MNAVVAIGGPPLLQAVNAYRALVPSAVWMLGLKTPRDPRDPLLRSLESLIEPVELSYFAAVAQAQAATMATHMTDLLLSRRDVDRKGTVSAPSAALWKDVAASLALVQMLDGAHAIQPVELVLNDDSSALARTAVAWARARGFPSVTIPAPVSLRRPWKPIADKTVVLGERSRRAYRAVDVDDSLVVNISPRGTKYGAGADERAAQRSAAKAAVTRALGWPESDIVVVFEPAANLRDSALEPPDSTGASLAAIFSALVLARASVPTLRLAVVGSPRPEGHTKAVQAAATAGLAAGDFAYSESDHDVWIAGADIVVSVDSTRSMDASGAGVPAVNLWRPSSWYLGPSFAAEDAVLDVCPHVLGATLVALAKDAALRTQVAGIARARLAIEAQTGAQAAVEIASQLLKHRRPAAVIASNPKLDIVIYSPPYWHGSAGHRALYRLCHLINLAGGDASIYPGTHLHPTWSTPRRTKEITDKTIVVYPEIYEQALPAQRVVRWCLNKPGLLGGPKSYGPEEMVFYYHQAYREAAQAATAEVLTDERELQIAVIEPELFYNDRSRPRLYDCVFVYKGQALYDRVQPREIRDAYMIQSGWPASRSETAALLRGCRKLYSFDAWSALVMEGVICGAEVLIVGEDGSLSEPIYGSRGYEAQYYDMAPAERFLRLLGERWG
jgi:hypothetical protein